MRTSKPTIPQSPLIKADAARILCARDVFKLLSPIAEGLEREHVWRIDLDARRHVIGCELVGMGTVDRVDIAPREVFRGACRNNAATILIAHNHTGGDPRPSHFDIRLTKRLVMCGLILGVDLVDHVVITARDFFSFRERRLL